MRILVMKYSPKVKKISYFSITILVLTKAICPNTTIPPKKDFY